jgi:hypothetical protein
MRSTKALLAILFGLAALSAGAASAADRPYTPGTVWTVTMVRVKYGMESTYLSDLAANWRRVMDAAKKQDLVVSYRILVGTAASRDDWSMLLLVESKNWAAFDGADDKFDAIVENMIGPEKAQMEQLVRRSDMREIVGVKNFQEVNFK